MIKKNNLYEKYSMSQPREQRRDEARINAAKLLSKILVKQFLSTNPNLDITKCEVNKGKNANLNIDQKLMGQVQLHPNVKSAICATVFGDGSIALQKGYANARIQYRHSTRQTDWFLWKSLGPFGKFTTENSIQFQAPDGKQKSARRLPGELLGKLKVSTSADPIITSLYKILAPNGQKTIQRSWLNHMTSWFLVTLWLDDGSLVGGSREGVICVNGLSLQEANILAEYIRVVWDVECKAVVYTSRTSKTNFESPQIEFADLDNLEKFLRIVAPLIPVKSMIYKVCLYPLDNTRLQRWTSDLKQMVRPEWHDEIDQIYAYYVITKGELSPEIDS